MIYPLTSTFMEALVISAGSSLRFGWESVKKHFWYFVGIAFVSMVISGIGSGSQDTNSWDLIGMLASVWMTCGTTTIFLMYRRGEKADFSVLFTSVDRFLSVLGATILVGLIVMAGLVLLIVPGIMWAIKYQFVVPLILDQKLGVMDAMRRSDAITKGRRMSIFLFDLTMLGAVILGALALVVGLFVAVPVVELATIDLYKKLLAATPTTQTA